MRLKPGFALNGAAHLASYALNTVLGTVVGIVVARHLGTSQYGMMAFVVAYTSLFQVLTSLGIDTIVMREISRRPERAELILGAALSLRMCLGSCAMVVAIGVAAVLVDDAKMFAIVIIHSVGLLFSYAGLYGVLFNVELRSHVPNIALGVWSVLYSGGRLALVSTDAEVVHFVIADVVSGLVVLVVSRWVMERYAAVRVRAKVDLSQWITLLRESWPIALMTWMIALHLRIDQAWLFKWSSPSEVGGYAASVRISEIWGVVATAFLMSAFPFLARRAVEGEEEFRRTSLLAYRWLYLFICPVALVLLSYPQQLLEILFGPAFSSAKGSLAILAVAEVFAFSNAVTYNVLLSSNRQLDAVFVATTSLICNVGLNVWLIPEGGAVGAATASLASYAAVPVLVLAVPRDRWIGRLAITSLARPVGAVGIAGSIAWAIGGGPLSGVLLIALFYPAMAFVFGGVDANDLRKAFAIIPLSTWRAQSSSGPGG